MILFRFVFSRVLRDSISHYVGRLPVSLLLPLPTSTRLGQPCIRPCLDASLLRDLGSFLFKLFRYHLDAVATFACWAL